MISYLIYESNRYKNMNNNNSIKSPEEIEKFRSSILKKYN